MAIIQQNTSNLARLAGVLDLKAKPESKYKRLKRFLKDAPPDYAVFARLMIAILNPSDKYILALDRTEWKYGKRWVNILTLSIVVGNTRDPALLANLESQRQFDIGGKTSDYNPLSGSFRRDGHCVFLC